MGTNSMNDSRLGKCFEVLPRSLFSCWILCLLLRNSLQLPIQYTTSAVLPLFNHLQVIECEDIWNKWQGSKGEWKTQRSKSAAGCDDCKHPWQMVAALRGHTVHRTSYLGSAGYSPHRIRLIQKHNTPLLQRSEGKMGCKSTEPAWEERGKEKLERAKSLSRDKFLNGSKL